MAPKRFFLLPIGVHDILFFFQLALLQIERHVDRHFNTLFRRSLVVNCLEAIVVYVFFQTRVVDALGGRLGTATA